MKTRRRGVSALIEHRRRDDWTYTPALVVEVAAAAAVTCWQGSDCRNNARKMKNILITILKIILVHDFPHQGEEAGSIVFHSSSSTSEIKNDDNEVSEDLSIKDAEILRLIEERRNTPKEEKQRLKEVSKCIKKCIREKNEKANGYPKNF